jgi:aminoglycoside phosphotransferase (APT) family kinase protein
MYLWPSQIRRSPSPLWRRAYAPENKADAADPQAVGRALRRCLAGGRLSYQERPQPIAWGWEAFTYHLQFRARPDLPPLLAGPLTVRIYSSKNGLSRARHEFAVQEQLRRLEFPVAKPLLLHSDCALFGGPFILMQRLTGQTLFHAMLARPWRLLGLSDRMAQLHARLHRLSAHDFPTGGGAFVSRRLQALRDLITEYGLGGLQAGLDWLSLHRPPPWHPASVLHPDWHPLNLIESANGDIGALDWSEADVGDPHADVASTLLLLRCVPVDCDRWWHSEVLPLGRWWMARRYLRTYRTCMPVDERRLHYYRAWAVLRRLADYGRWLTAGPASTGCKPDALRHLQPCHVTDLCHLFWRQTGVAVHL